MYVQEIYREKQGEKLMQCETKKNERHQNLKIITQSSASANIIRIENDKNNVVLNVKHLMRRVSLTANETTLVFR